jgi:hypothetical protein
MTIFAWSLATKDISGQSEKMKRLTKGYKKDESLKFSMSIPERFLRQRVNPELLQK